MVERRRITAAAIGVALLGMGALSGWRVSATQRGAPRSIILSIVGTSDVHGALLPKDGRGGLALFAGYMQNLRAARMRDGGAVLLIDAGDIFQGTLESNLTEGAAVVAAYNRLGYAAAAIGNHEFDFGPVGPATTPRGPADDSRGALKARAAEAKFPFLAANVFDTSTGRPVDWPNVKPSVIVDVAGVKVGIIGVTTRDTLKTTIAANVHGLSIAPLAGTIAAEAFRLRLRGANIVIVAAHAGGRCTMFDNPADLSSCEADREIMDVARALPAAVVDGIVAGHTHLGMAHEVHGISITEAYSSGRAFGRVDYSVDVETKQVEAKKIFAPQDVCERENPKTHGCNGVDDKDAPLVAATYEGGPVVADPAVAALVAPFVALAAPIKGKTLGVVLDTPIRRAALRGESPLGNFFVDTLRAGVPNVDVAIYNTTGLRADLPAGPLSYGSFYEAYPFGNVTVRLNLTGAALRKVLAAQLESPIMTILISGVRVRATCAGGNLDVALLRPTGRPIVDDEPLIVVVPDFLATGGDGILTPIMPPQGFAVPDDAAPVGEALAEWLTRRGGHVREDKLVDTKNPRWKYPGALPVNCAAK